MKKRGQVCAHDCVDSKVVPEILDIWIGVAGSFHWKLYQIAQPSLIFSFGACTPGICQQGSPVRQKAPCNRRVVKSIDSSACSIKWYCVLGAVEIGCNGAPRTIIGGDLQASRLSRQRLVLIVNESEIAVNGVIDVLIFNHTAATFCDLLGTIWRPIRISV